MFRFFQISNGQGSPLIKINSQYCQITLVYFILNVNVVEQQLITLLHILRTFLLYIQKAPTTLSRVSLSNNTATYL